MTARLRDTKKSLDALFAHVLFYDFADKGNEAFLPVQCGDEGAAVAGVVAVRYGVAGTGRLAFRGFRAGGFLPGFPVFDVLCLFLAAFLCPAVWIS